MNVKTQLNEEESSNGTSRDRTRQCCIYFTDEEYNGVNHALQGPEPPVEGILRQRIRHSQMKSVHASCKLTNLRGSVDRSAGKGTNSLGHYNLVHKFSPMPQAMKIPDAKGSTGKIMGTTRENTVMAADERQKPK